MPDVEISAPSFSTLPSPFLDSRVFSTQHHGFFLRLTIDAGPNTTTKSDLGSNARVLVVPSDASCAPVDRGSTVAVQDADKPQRAEVSASMLDLRTGVASHLLLSPLSTADGDEACCCCYCCCLMPAAAHPARTPASSDVFSDAPMPWW